MNETQVRELIGTERVIEVNKHPEQTIKVTILDYDGKITIDGGGSVLRGDIDTLVGEKVKNLVLNFDSVTYVDSTGFGVLLYCYTACKSIGATVKILKPSQKVLDEFGIMGLFKYFDTFFDEDEVIASF